MLMTRLTKEGKTVLKGAAFALLVVIALWSVIRGRGPGGANRVAAVDCRAAYQRARTATESSMVDRQTPIVSKGQAAFAKSCEMMRLDGDLNGLP